MVIGVVTYVNGRSFGGKMVTFRIGMQQLGFETGTIQLRAATVISGRVLAGMTIDSPVR
jgi:hypothetical protein